MHELGVVFHIADSLAKIAEENHVARISRVTLQLGEVSTVVPEYLTDVWSWNCKRTPLLTGCALEIERIPAVTHCGACGQDYPTVPQGKRCPRCGSEDTWLIQRDRRPGRLNTQNRQGRLTLPVSYIVAPISAPGMRRAAQKLFHQPRAPEKQK